MPLTLNQKVDSVTSEKKRKREAELSNNRKIVFDYIYDILGLIRDELSALIPRETAKTAVSSVRPDQPKYYYHTRQIAEYATSHKYYFNRNMPRGWFGVHFILPTENSYNLIISVHHYGYDDDVLAVGSFMEYSETINGEEEKKLIPINVEPFTISLEGLGENTKDNLDSYIHDILKIGLTIIINEIN